MVSFSLLLTTCAESMEVDIAGSCEERNALMPLLYIEESRQKTDLEMQVKQVLKDFHHGGQSMLSAENRMKPLDVVKVLMGIQSSRECVKRF